jgi:hypothetical protein
MFGAVAITTFINVQASGKRVLFGDDGTEAPEWQVRRVQGQKRRKKGKYD